MKVTLNICNPAVARQPMLLLIGLVLIIGLGGCSKDAQQAEPGKDKAVEKATPVKIEIVKAAPLVLTVSLTGSVEAGRIAQLASPAEGPVLHVKVREGDMVKRGQVLVSLGRTEGATALVDSLREDLKKEDDNLARTRQLVESGAIPAEQLDAAIANSARIKAQLVKAKESTRDYQVSAPWSGVVSKSKVRDGDFVGPRAPLIEIYDPASLVVQLSLPEQNAAAIVRGMKAQVELDAYPEKRFSGSVTRLYPFLDPRTRTRIAEITVLDAPKLLPGMFARAYLTQKTIADAITVPAYSLVASPGGGVALFVAQDGKAIRRKVEKGIELDGRVQILSGLNAGEKLIIGGHEKLKDGAAVKGPEKAADKGVAATKPEAAQGKQTNPSSIPVNGARP